MTYGPEKYYRGLSKRQATRRRGEISRRAKKSWLDPAAYNPFKTDKGVKTRKSGYTKAWQGKFPKAKSLEEKAKATGVPLTYIRQCYNRGLAAWRTGHRPGATQQQWGYARGTFLFDVWEDLQHDGFGYSAEGESGVRGGKEVVD